jgi:hypothetical protein
MRREDLIQLFAAARLHAHGDDDPWPDDLWLQEIIRLLRERSRTVMATLK